MIEQKYDTHFVIKVEDVAKYLTEAGQIYFTGAVDKILCGRKKDGRNSSYYVCNTDEPYADKVLQIILEGENEKSRRVYVIDYTIVEKGDQDAQFTYTGKTIYATEELCRERLIKKGYHFVPQQMWFAKETGNTWEYATISGRTLIERW